MSISKRDEKTTNEKANFHFRCSVCVQNLETLEELTLHLEEHNRVIKDLNFRCGKCTKDSASVTGICSVQSNPAG